MERGRRGVFALDQIGPFGLLTAGASVAGLMIARVIVFAIFVAKWNADLAATAQFEQERFLLMRKGACH